MTGLKAPIKTGGTTVPRFVKQAEPPPTESEQRFQRYAWDPDLKKLPSYMARLGETMPLSDTTPYTKVINRLRRREKVIREYLR